MASPRESFRIHLIPLRHALIAGLSLMVLAACAETRLIVHTAKRVTGMVETEPAQGVYKVGDPYQIEDVWYYPAVDYTYEKTGIASWYGSKFQGRLTANGEVFDMNELSAAHRTLPLPSIVQVTNLENGRSLLLRVNDRGPFAHGRIIDVSRRASQLLGFQRQGTARVRVRIMARESRDAVARIRGETMVAGKDTPIIVSSLPKGKVSSQILPALPGAVEAPGPVLVALPKPPLDNSVVVAAAKPELGKVTVQPVGPTTLYVQAGAFTYFDNANKTRARLSGLGSVRVSSILVGGKDLFRVRVGPIATVEEADRMLERVIRSGYSDAQIIVD